MPAILDQFAGVRRILFVPFAIKDREGYTARARERFKRENIAVDALGDSPAEAGAIVAAEAVFVGGGNTFRLLDTLQRTGALELLRRRALDGLPYMGSSAGSVIAAPTLMTTNDMPIVQPRSFDALGLVPFQINAHYMDPDPASRHMGETREERIGEFLEENAAPVVGLREGAWLSVRDDEVRLGGRTGARLFRRGRDPVEAKPGSVLDLGV
jgi:dipeptidase E